MTWLRSIPWSCCCLLIGLSCGPQAVKQIDDTDTDTDTDTDSDTDANADTGTGGSTPMTSAGPTTTTSGADSTGVDPGETTDDCPVGTVNCLCDIGATCEEGLLCQDGTCVSPPACEQPEGEPNGDEASAVELPDLGCSDGPATTNGVLDGVDADWFTFHGIAGFTCFGGPSAQVTAEADIVLCAYFECDQGNTNVQCTAPATASDSPDGRPGCCSTNQVDVGSIDCGITNGETAQVYIRATAVDAVCLEYELEYEF